MLHECSCDNTYWKIQKLFLNALALAKRPTGRDRKASWMHLRKDLLEETEMLLECTCEKTYWKRKKSFLNALAKIPTGRDINARWMYLRETYWKRQKCFLNAGRWRFHEGFTEVQFFNWVFCPTFITLKVAWGIITSQTIRLAVSPSSFSYKCQRILCPKSA